MKTINHEADHKHSWRCIGAHALHAGRKLTNPGRGRLLREVRHVFVCSVPGCAAVRVSISHHDVSGTEKLKQPRPVRFRLATFDACLECKATVGSPCRDKSGSIRRPHTLRRTIRVSQ